MLYFIYLFLFFFIPCSEINLCTWKYFIFVLTFIFIFSSFSLSLSHIITFAFHSHVCRTAEQCVYVHRGMHNIQMRALYSLDILYFRFHNAFHFRVFLIVVSFAPLNVTSFICHFSTSLLWIGKLDERAFTFVAQLCNALWNSELHGILECERERCVYSNSCYFLNSYGCSVHLTGLMRFFIAWTH